MNILAIDPGSTSTKIGILINDSIIKETISHKRDTIDSFDTIIAQKTFRFKTIKDYISDTVDKDLKFDAVIGRGGLVKPLESGVYFVNDIMLNDLTKGINGHHASNLGGILANEFGRLYNCSAYIADPVVVDELDSIARLSGFRDIQRKSIFHALNQKAAALKASKQLNKDYNSLNLIVAHMGGGISVGLHKKGRVVDVNNALNGDGPFAIERTGSLPIADIVQLIKDNRYTPDELLSIFSKKGGVYSYLGLTDMIEIEDRIKKGDEYAKLIIDGLIYQVSKEIGALACACRGDIDSIVLTGGLANSCLITDSIRSMVEFISKVMVFGGEFELEALIDSARKVLLGELQAKLYV